MSVLIPQNVAHQMLAEVINWQRKITKKFGICMIFHYAIERECWSEWIGLSSHETGAMITLCVFLLVKRTRFRIRWNIRFFGLKAVGLSHGTVIICLS